jgi:hypothetical protein
MNAIGPWNHGLTGHAGNYMAMIHSPASRKKVAGKIRVDFGCQSR